MSDGTTRTYKISNVKPHQKEHQRPSRQHKRINTKNIQYLADTSINKHMEIKGHRSVELQQLENKENVSSNHPTLSRK